VVKRSSQLFENQIVDDERLLTKKELASFLNVSVKMIDRKVYLNEIPYLKLGYLVRFSKSAVLAWAQGNLNKR
jgi:excisionase family DNA binding protein